MELRQTVCCFVFWVVFGFAVVIIVPITLVHLVVGVVDTIKNETAPEEADESLYRMTRTVYKGGVNWGFVTDQPCADFYGYACGAFLLPEENEYIHYVNTMTNLKLRKINEHIIPTGENCVTPGAGCMNAHRYYERCLMDEGEDRVQPIINKVYRELKGGKYEMIRVMVKNGITNFVHLTKERLPGVFMKSRLVYRWTHYLGPGGVLFPEETIHLGLYGSEGLQTSQKQEMTLGSFLESFPEMRPVFGPNAIDEDVLFVENLEYFENLYLLVKDLSVQEVQSRLKWYVRHALRYLDAQSCLDQAKLLFPTTMCRTFARLDARQHDYEEMGRREAQKIMAEYPDLGISVRVGGCSSLLHNDGAADLLVAIENQYFVNYTLEEAHEKLFKKWYDIYDPVYLYFTYPRSLEHAQDPLEWYSDTNAFYDRYHNEVVIPPGMTQFPILNENYEEYVRDAIFGYIVGHEIAHFYTDDETRADVIGLSKAFEASDGSCNFFLAYAQFFCATFPLREYDTTHGSAWERVNAPIKFGSTRLVERFNQCFVCEYEPIVLE